MRGKLGGDSRLSCSIWSYKQKRGGGGQVDRSGRHAFVDGAGQSQRHVGQLGLVCLFGERVRQRVGSAMAMQRSHEFGAVKARAGRCVGRRIAQPAHQPVAIMGFEIGNG